MTTPNPMAAKILIATDLATDANLVKKSLQDEFDHIFISANPDSAVQDFEQHRPDVLVLAFNTLEKSERFYLGLHRHCPVVHEHPHRTVILCSKDELKQVYQLCRKDLFDDYVLFWPMTFDMSRLPMSIHCALREMAAHKSGAPAAAEFAAQARLLAELQATLDRQVAEGSQHIDSARRGVARAEQQVGAALDGFSRRLIQGELPGAVEVRNADALQQEIGRIKRDEIQQMFRAASEFARPAAQWAEKFKQACAPQMESLSALNASMAERTPATVLVVDDDELQQQIIAQILAAQNYQLVFASNGIEALSLLRKMHPDVILMDMMMPQMDGLETTQRLKALPQFATVPVIMITGQGEKQLVVDSLKAGARDFVVKPVKAAALIDKLRLALGSAG
ncbi:MAG: response regulator [Rhodocyclaceae bacterium]|nr:response regulator [Rhodocyclaceae bacterium]